MEAAEAAAAKAAEVASAKEADEAAAAVELQEATAAVEAAAAAAAEEEEAAAEAVAHEPRGTSVDAAAAAKSTEALVFSLRRATMGRDRGSVSELILLGRAIEEAEAAGADAGKLRVAREVVEREGKLPEDPALRFW